MLTSRMKVYVKSKSGKWLMPTNPANARRLLKQDKAKVIQRTPFAIKLLYKTTEYTQPVTVGIDDGGISVGVAAVAEDKVLYQKELHLRADIKTKMDTRRSYRRGRRHRKTRYRKPRWQNRKNSIPRCKVCGGNAPKSHVICRACLRKVDGVHQKYANIKKSFFRLPPSIKAKKDAILQTVRRLPIPINKIRLEDAYFDFQAMDNPKITGEQYQYGELFYHKNYKQACKVRDGFKCRVCKSSENLQVHHIKGRIKGGSDRLSNLMTLCKDCHDKYHTEGLKLPKQKTSFYIAAAHVQQGKNYLQHQLSAIAPLETTFGYITSHYRNQAHSEAKRRSGFSMNEVNRRSGSSGLEKSHVNDAVMIANPSAAPIPGFIRTNCVASRKRSLHEATARKGRKEPNRTQKRNAKNTFSSGIFRRWDTVRYKDGRIGFISGFTGKSACRIVDIHGNYIKNPGKNYTQVPLKDIQLIHRNQSEVSQFLPS